MPPSVIAAIVLLKRVRLASATMYPLEAILGLYQAINPAVENLAQALLWFNCPFTLFKALCDVAITFLVYKKISPLIHGKAD